LTRKSKNLRDRKLSSLNKSGDKNSVKLKKKEKELNYTFINSNLKITLKQSKDTKGLKRMLKKIKFKKEILDPWLVK
jgi:hypothetical protein